MTFRLQDPLLYQGYPLVYMGRPCTDCVVSRVIGALSDVV